jgi:hypothetical protein
VLVAARAALPVPLEQVDDGVHGLVRCRRPFEGKAEQVHPEQRLVAPVAGSSREDRLVADHDPVLVGADLRTPHPPRLAQQDRIRVWHLVDLGPGARHA